MIPNGPNQNCLAVTRISALFRGITSNHNGDYYCFNSFDSYATENKIKSQKIICKNHDCYIEMSEESNNTMKYNHGKNAITIPLNVNPEGL